MCASVRQPAGAREVDRQHFSCRNMSSRTRQRCRGVFIWRLHLKKKKKGGFQSKIWRVLGSWNGIYVNKIVVCDPPLEKILLIRTRTEFISDQNRFCPRIVERELCIGRIRRRQYTNFVKNRKEMEISNFVTLWRWGGNEFIIETNGRVSFPN